MLAVCKVLYIVADWLCLISRADQGGQGWQDAQQVPQDPATGDPTHPAAQAPPRPHQEGAYRQGPLHTCSTLLSTLPEMSVLLA